MNGGDGAADVQSPVKSDHGDTERDVGFDLGPGPAGRTAMTSRVTGIVVFLACLAAGTLPSFAAGEVAAPAAGVRSLVDTGIKQRRSGLYEESIRTLERAVALARRTGDADGEWSARTFLALTYQLKGELNHALALHEENRAFARSRGELVGEVMNRESDSIRAIAAIHILMGNHVKAAETLREDVATARGERHGLGRAKQLQRMGINLFRAGKAEEAGKTLAAALAEFEAESDRIGHYRGYEPQVEVVRWLQAVRVAEGKIDEALELAERGRARDLGSLLVRSRARAATEQSIPDVGRMKRIAAAQRTTLVIYSVLYEYDASLPLEFSRFEQLPATDLFIWVIQPTEHITFRKLTLPRQPDSLVDLVRNARMSIAARSPRETEGAAANPSQSRPMYRHLRRLYDVLVGPIADVLPVDATDRVTFVPQDALFLVPFAALQDGQGVHLIERHAIATTPSVQALELVAGSIEDTGQEATGVLIVGNPMMPRIRRLPDGSPETLARLPGTEHEATAVARLLKSTAVTGEQATKARVVPSMAAAGVVHLATHGLIDDAGGGFNALALAPDDHDTGLLTAREVRALRLKADLIVLSACDTGRGKITGDGIDGLSRSFLAAGARSLVVSLWQVADAATALLMMSFYENLQKGHDKAQALRQAMLATRSQYPDPWRWSAFILVGSADVSPGLRALFKGEPSSRQPTTRLHQDGDQGIYRYLVFPLPDRARLTTERYSANEASAHFTTDLGAGELVTFYRRELSRRGLRENATLTSSDGREFQLVFDGLSAGPLVIQGKGWSRDEDGSVSLRIESRKRQPR